jgi:hypothetical protein
VKSDRDYWRDRAFRSELAAVELAESFVDLAEFVVEHYPLFNTASALLEGSERLPREMRQQSGRVAPRNMGRSLFSRFKPSSRPAATGQRDEDDPRETDVPSGITSARLERLQARKAAAQERVRRLFGGNATQPFS